MCNLSSGVVQAEDDLLHLEDKIRVAAILGTWQSCLTNFRYITKAWKNNCEEERLLGVSMTNIMANDLLNGRTRAGRKDLPEVLEHLKQIAIDTNKEWAERLSIPQSTAITCVKPEGNGTQLAGVHGSGIHPVWSEYHIRRVRELADGPITAMLLDAGFDGEPDIHDPAQMVFSFPKQAPANSVFRKDMTAIQQLDHWKTFQDHWCEHKPSITVYAREKEWPAVGGWVYDNFDQMSGVSFLPYSDHIYKQAPYEEITKAEYASLMDQQPDESINLPDALAAIENEDTTTGGRELACSAGVCDV
jgi:ribonucleoside-diphosphate reductase alpha chain